MPRRMLTRLPAALLLTGLLAGVSASAAGAATASTCAGLPSFSCSTVAVPLDRQLPASPAIGLSVARRPAAGGPTSTAVIALAGGPGQAALPLAEFMAKAIAPALTTRDLVVFDQRGTGSSDPLDCPALSSSGTVGSAFERCALELGPSRGAFTTEESVEDIEAIRQAYGYTKLVLYGTSYGTKVALAYAERYPANVEGLVLDSVVPTDGPEPFGIPTFEAIAPVLNELCSDGACDGITTHPVTDIAHLNAQLRRRPLSGSVYDGSGHRHQAILSELGLFEILEAGDLNPALRALLPAAVQSALRHDPDPLLRLHLLSEGLIPNIPNSPSEEPPSEGGDGVDEALFVTTNCEELPFPWQRAAATQTRLSEAFGYLHAQPAGSFYPFESTTAVQSSFVIGCAAWPDASPAPPAQHGPPDVPTLILSGEQDLTTPTTGARSVAAEIPGAQVEVVPYTGHSVLGSDLSGCAERAVSEFFATTSVQPCGVGRNDFTPTPIVPAALSQVHAPRALPGNAGKTLAAALDTILDLQRQIIAATLQADGELPERVGLRRVAGRLRAAHLHAGASEEVLLRLRRPAQRLVPGERRCDPNGDRAGLRQRRSGRIDHDQPERPSHRHTWRPPVRREPREDQALPRGPRRMALEGAGPPTRRPARTALDRRALRAAGDAERTGRGDLAVSAPARREPRRLAALGTAGAGARRRGGQAAARLDRVLRLPLVPRDGARVLRGPGHGQGDERELHLREGRPRGATRRRRALHGGRAEHDRTWRLAPERLPHARAGPLLRRNLFPARGPPGHALLDAGAAVDRRRVGREQRARSAPAPSRSASVSPGRPASSPLGSRSQRAPSTGP